MYPANISLHWDEITVAKVLSFFNDVIEDHANAIEHLTANENIEMQQNL